MSAKSRMRPKDKAMQQVLGQQVTVEAGGKVELVCLELKAGEIVNVVVSATRDPEPIAGGQRGDENAKL